MSRVARIRVRVARANVKSEERGKVWPVYLAQRVVGDRTHKETNGVRSGTGHEQRCVKIQTWPRFAFSCYTAGQVTVMVPAGGELLPMGSNSTTYALSPPPPQPQGTPPGPAAPPFDTEPPAHPPLPPAPCSPCPPWRPSSPAETQVICSLLKELGIQDCAATNRTHKKAPELHALQQIAAL